MPNELATVIAEKLNLTFDFVQMHAAEVLAQFIAYKKCMSAINMVIGIALLIIGGTLMYLLIKAKLANNKMHEANWAFDSFDITFLGFFAMGFGVVGLLIGAVWTINGIFSVIGWTLYPYARLLEMIM